MVHGLSLRLEKVHLGPLRKGPTSWWGDMAWVRPTVQASYLVKVVYLTPWTCFISLTPLTFHTANQLEVYVNNPHPFRTFN